MLTRGTIETHVAVLGAESYEGDREEPKEYGIVEYLQLIWVKKKLRRTEPPKFS